LLDDADLARDLASKARAHVVEDWDMAAITKKLAESFVDAVAEKRGGK